MEYYFSKDDYNLGTYSNATKLKYLKEYSDSKLRKVKKKLEMEFNLDYLNTAWVSKSTFGTVFVDFTPKKTGPTILGAHKRLFELICHDVKYLIVSKKISRNFIYKDVDDFKVLAINIDSYKTFIKSFANQEQRIRLYLFRLHPEEEEIINNWLQAKHSTNIDNAKISEEDLLEYLNSMNIDSIPKFKSFLERFNNIIKNKISSNIHIYQEKLDKFDEMIYDETIYEPKLSKFLHDNPWILDFKYLNQRLDTIENEYETDVGNVDIFISEEQFGIKKDMIIELKTPEKKIIKSYRDKPAITAVVGNALSQLINYMETQKGPDKVLNGLLILGRKNDGFLQKFNEHLSKINVVTYEQIAKDCQTVLDVFKSEATPQNDDKDDLL